MKNPGTAIRTALATMPQEGDAYRVANTQAARLARLVTELEEALQRLQPEESRLGVAIPAAVKTALEFEEQELSLLESQVKPITLVASMDGVVSGVLRRTGWPSSASFSSRVAEVFPRQS